MQVILDTDRATLVQGDALDVLKQLGANTADALVTDPPAGISFMGKAWDDDKGGREQWIAWLASVMREAHRVLKPGAHALVWALPRTSHWTATALEEAGFEIRDRVSHLFGTGFPKSLNLSKALDEHFGAERPVLEVRGTEAAGLTDGGYSERVPDVVTGAVTEQAQAWDGWGTALKPACEDWWLVRKPLVGTYVENVLAHGVGGLNVDGCRIETTDDRTRPNSGRKGGGGVYGNSETYTNESHEGGRWPANVTLGHSPDCENIRAALETQANWLAENGEEPSVCTHLLDLAESACAPDCAVRALDEQSGHLKSGGTPKQRSAAGSVARGGGEFRSQPTARQQARSIGGASRFFYTAKVSRAERDFGCEGLPVKSGADMTGREEGSDGLQNPRAGAGRGGGARNFHPTVKPQSLMRWLVRLITPPGGVVLDPFAGSGSTGVAALHEGCRFLGVELGAEYTPITKARLERALADTGTTARAA